ncbi:MAG TPA: sensor domain-containing protein [Streptosporangiaceae bacterium]|nr:sensor domain-containing protein [Streptosporangiaceae bacterium]
MNGTITKDTTRNQASSGNWATHGAVATARGMVLFGFTLASLMPWTVLLTGVALIPLGAGLPLTAVALRAIRGLEGEAWRHAAGWHGFAAAAPRPAGPAGQEEREPGFWVRFGSLMADPDTWRSLVWSTVDILAGWLFTLVPAGLIAWGLFGVAMPAVWHPLVTAHANTWYAFIHVTTASTAWLSVALGIAFIAVGLLSAPSLLRRYGALARSVLAPAG